MTSFNRRVYEMLVRLIVFAKTYPQFFGQDTFPGQLMAQIEAAVQRLSEHVTSQTAGEGSVKVATDERKKARAELRGQLEGISRIGKGLGLTEFMIPRDRNDVALVHVGRTWSSLVQQHKQKFLDSRMPGGFHREARCCGPEIGAHVSRPDVLDRHTAVRNCQDRPNANGSVRRVEAIGSDHGEPLARQPGGFSRLGKRSPGASLRECEARAGAGRGGGKGGCVTQPPIRGRLPKLPNSQEAN